MRVWVENLNFAYKSPDLVLKNISMDALPGEVTALIGPNASGKTTLLRCIAEKLASHGNISPVSYLPQEISSHAELSVFETVLLGRLQSLPWRVDEETVAIVQKILENLEIEGLALRFLDELSGGQRQMVWIAQALVREPEVLLLDEPIHNLDIYHQLEILDLISRVTREREIATIIVVHELNMAARYADKVVVLIIINYQHIIRQKIENSKMYPAIARRRGIEGKVFVNFTIGQNGFTDNIKIVSSSGFEILDKEAIAAVKRANPFPPIPGELSCSSLNIKVAIVFSLV